MMCDLQDVRCFFFFSSRRRHTRCREVSWARRCVQETDPNLVFYCHIKTETYQELEVFQDNIHLLIYHLKKLHTECLLLLFLHPSSLQYNLTMNKQVLHREQIKLQSFPHVLCVDTLSLIHI
eukprot:TRINITY_DN38381_c0_g1_i1.p1 TRINITY_DN38381_c0_g1~~TRINITY_DN38381_c0_g1_i1.p1  ORF type:complete len:122 (-),score=29.54 TRINITY_DN38381_c0_g1_i1:81-446(-)